MKADNLSPNLDQSRHHTVYPVEAVCVGFGVERGADHGDDGVRNGCTCYGVRHNTGYASRLLSSKVTYRDERDQRKRESGATVQSSLVIRHIVPAHTTNSGRGRGSSQPRMPIESGPKASTQ